MRPAVLLFFLPMKISKQTPNMHIFHRKLTVLVFVPLFFEKLIAVHVKTGVWGAKSFENFGNYEGK